jgi:hypothetical protein
MTKPNMPFKDPGAMYALWSSVPEPVKAALLNIILGAVMAFRTRDKTFWAAVAEVTAGGVITFVVGSTIEAFGLSSGWGFAAGGAIAVFGIDQVKAFATKWADRRSTE